MLRVMKEKREVERWMARFRIADLGERSEEGELTWWSLITYARRTTVLVKIMMMLIGRWCVTIKC